MSIYPVKEIESIVVGARLLRRLPSFLRHPLDPDQAQSILRERRERREIDFLDLAAQAIYSNPASPYRQLLSLAGCEYGDLEKLTYREGVEGALRTLFQHGVYFTTDEFKGRRPTVRGSSTIAVDPTRLRNPNAALHLFTQTSGSRGARTRVPIDIAHIRDRAVNFCLHLDASGGARWSYALWGVPGGSRINRLLQYAHAGHTPVRWFSQVDPNSPLLRSRFGWTARVWSARVLRWGSVLAGVPLPSPQYVPQDNPLPIAQWMAEVLRAGGTPHLHCFASWAVRLCQTACDAGIDIEGAQFSLTGEPFTANRQTVIHEAGAAAVPVYGMDETGGLISHGCLAPNAPDDTHLYDDLHALIQSESDDMDPALPPGALLISSLRKTAPLILLNVSTGDRADVVQRECSCPLERLGWRTHLQTIRSFEKLTVGGMALLDSDVIRVLEEVLPVRFGGGPTHYQLLEDETNQGQPRLRLLIDPLVGPLDVAAVADAFLTAIASTKSGGWIEQLVWRQGDVLRVERRTPRRTASGKIQHVHLERSGMNQQTPDELPRDE